MKNTFSSFWSYVFGSNFNKDCVRCIHLFFSLTYEQYHMTTMSLQRCGQIANLQLASPPSVHSFPLISPPTHATMSTNHRPVHDQHGGGGGGGGGGGYPPRNNGGCFPRGCPVFLGVGGAIFSQDDVDMALYGYARQRSTTDLDHVVGHSLSGLRIGEFSYGSLRQKYYLL